ncbi:MAG: Ig-like domain repeat protein [Chloroflexi bacterium]|nr:Ig-like domain repeat protein [Chloroflexota bacterium]
MKKPFIVSLAAILLSGATFLNACASQKPSAPPFPSPSTSLSPVSFAGNAPSSLPAAATATTLPSGLSAILKEISGKVEIKPVGEEAFIPATTNSLLQEQGQVLTGDDGRVRLDLSSGTIIRLAPNSLFTLISNQPADESLKTRLQLAVGKLFVILNGGSLEVETPTGTAAVRGSYMSVVYDPASGETRITCLEGNCSLENQNGRVEITAGQTAVIRGAGQPPQAGYMSQEDFQEWLNNSPEAKIIIESLFPFVIPTPSPLPQIYFPPSGKKEPPAAPSLTPIITIVNVSPYASVSGQTIVVGVSVQSSPGGPTPTGTVKVRANSAYFCAAALDASGNANCAGGIAHSGLYDLTAEYFGDENYLPAQSAPFYEYTVSPASTLTTLVSHNPSPSLAGAAVTFTATVDALSPGAGTPYGSVTFSDGSVNTCVASSAPWECAITFANPGSYAMTAAYSGDANFNGSVSSPVIHDVLASVYTEFRNPGGPTSVIAVCAPAYQTQALDVDGVNLVEVEYRIGDSVFIASDLKQALSFNNGTGYWEGMFVIPALNTDTVYWRFIATDGLGNKTFLGNGFTYTVGYTGAAVDAYSYTGPTCP